MTAQIADVFRVGEKSYRFVRATKHIDFNPYDYGIIPTGRTTANHRGYVSSYEISQGGLFLKGFRVHSLMDSLPAIDGVLPLSEASGINSRYREYRGLNIRLPYTGRLLLGDGFMHEFYIHSGFQRPWAFSELRELVFTDGTLTGDNDHSSYAQEIRLRLGRRTPVLTRAFVSELPDGLKEAAWWLPGYTRLR